MTDSQTTSVRLVASGSEWLAGSNALPIEDAMCELISGANRTIQMTMYSIWTGYEFADRIWNELSNAAARGVHVYLVVNRFDEQDSESAKARVSGMMQSSPETVGVRSFDDQNRGIMHAKMTIADEQIAIISSSNQSDAGYSRNHEIGVLLEGPQANRASQMFRMLYESDSCSAITPPPPPDR